MKTDRSVWDCVFFLYVTFQSVLLFISEMMIVLETNIYCCFRVKGKKVSKGKTGGVNKNAGPGLLSVQSKKPTVSNKIHL
jgi:hypothetical protein